MKDLYSHEEKKERNHSLQTSLSPELLLRQWCLTSGRVLTEMSRRLCKDLPNHLAALERMSGRMHRVTGTREPDTSEHPEAGPRT